MFLNSIESKEKIQIHLAAPDIAFVTYASENCLDVYLFSGAKHVVRWTIKETYQWMKEKNIAILKCSKSTLVTMDCIQEIKEDKVIIKDTVLALFDEATKKILQAIELTRDGHSDYKNMCANERSAPSSKKKKP
jgi:hypothetical protein